jgi:hypothetical protein
VALLLHRGNVSGKVMDREAYGTTPGTLIWLYQVTGANNQKWAFNATDLTLRAIDSGLCLDGKRITVLLLYESFY